jgi:hypothetical protein
VLTRVLASAVLDHGWHAAAAMPALLAIAADPATRSPARIMCAGPWWDDERPGGGTPRTGVGSSGEFERLEAQLAQADGRRVWAQRLACEQLTPEQRPLTRFDVARRACQILDDRASAHQAC